MGHLCGKAQIIAERYERINDYEINFHHCLGQGSFGKVYSGRRLNGSNNEQLAFKLIKLSKHGAEKELQLIRKEYQLGHEITHENIVKFIDMFQQQSTVYLVMQKCDGTLSDLINAKKKNGCYFDQDAAFFIVGQICSAFSVLSQKGIIHRDLKPDNVMIKDGILKIGDFGASKVMNFFESVKSYRGTPLYMPLEVMLEQKYTDKYDVWALGCIFYELLHDQLPWIAMNDSERTQFFKDNLKKQKIQQISEMKISPHLNYESMILLNQCLQFDHNRRCDWNKLLTKYSQKNLHLKNQAQKFRSDFRRELQNCKGNPNSSKKLSFASTSPSYNISKTKEQTAKVNQKMSYSQIIAAQRKQDANQIEMKKKEEANKKEQEKQKLKKIFQDAAFGKKNLINIVNYLKPLFQNDLNQVEKHYNQNKNREKYNWDSIDWWKKYHGVDLTEKGFFLIHKSKRVIMQDFVLEKDWNHIEQINCFDCEIDDAGWRLFVDHAHLFTNLKLLSIAWNKISEIIEGDLDRFKSIQYIGLDGNPMTSESITAVKRFKEKNPQIKIRITINGNEQYL